MTFVFVETTRRAAIFFKSFVFTTSVLILCVLNVFSFAQDVSESDASYTTGLAKYRSGDYTGAVTDIERFIVEFPESPKRNQAELYLGAAYLARGSYSDRAEFARAQQCFNYVMSQGENAPFYREAFFHSCRITYKTHAYRQALVLIKEFLRLYPDDPFSAYAHYYAGDCAAQLEEFESALSSFDASSRFKGSPFCWDCVVRRAEIFIRTGRFIEADQEIKRLELKEVVPDAGAQSQSLDVPRLRANFFLAQGRYEEAIAYLENFPAAATEKPDEELRVVLAFLEAQARYSSGDLVGSESCIKRCEESSEPTLAGVKLLKIKLALEGNRVDEAEKELALLTQSEFGANNRDVITATNTSIKLARGKYDETIDALVELLKARSDVGARVLFQYYDVRKSNGLDSEDFIDACETLTFAFIRRAKEQKDANALQSQEAVFQATLNYATTLGDPTVTRKVLQIDRKRQKALEELKNVDFNAPNEQTTPPQKLESSSEGTTPQPLTSIESSPAEKTTQTEVQQKEGTNPQETPSQESSAQEANPQGTTPQESSAQGTNPQGENVGQETNPENAPATDVPQNDKQPGVL